MEDNDYVLAFDHFYTTNHIQILKSLLPFVDNDNFRMLPVLIKYMELKYTLTQIGRGTSGLSGKIHASSLDFGIKSNANTDMTDNLETIYKAVHKYLAPGEEKSFNQILSAIRTMKNVREMQQMMELFQSMNPDMGAGMDLGSMMENLSAGGDGAGGLNLNEMMEMMKLFGGNDNGNK
ncbi:MAG: hypothetical protein K2P39_11860 [Lachnospiraceae bacterium]|nr:hypothetical protein [Lachnospiraceae bacterium]MDE7028740.1 hypothetical protein [Lachnospiraceae bacterium]